MWIGIAALLVVIWLVSFLALHISSALIHLILVLLYPGRNQQRKG